MGLFTNQIAPITGYSGANPTFGTAQNFDSLRIPPLSAQQAVEVVRQPGSDFHGLRLGAINATPITAVGVLFGQTPADGVAAINRLRGYTPSAGAANYYGVLVYWSYDTANPEPQRIFGPYSVLGADYVRDPRTGEPAIQRLLDNVGGTVIAAPIRYRFEIAIQLLQRQNT